MLFLLTGGAKNGKSSLAQQICSAISSEKDRVYLATMQPHDSEDFERIRLHQQDRKELCFATVECPCDIASSLEKILLRSKASTVLLDSITALLGNQMFHESEVNLLAGQQILEGLETLYHSVNNLVIVSDGIFSDANQFEELTERYRRSLAELEKQISEKADVVIEMKAGDPLILKGQEMFEKLGVLDPEKKNFTSGFNKFTFIIGGAFQGKTDYAKKQFSLVQKDIYECTKELAPDLNRRCVTHLENYVWYALKTETELEINFPDEAVLIMDDIFCGVVPMDAFERRWREECGRYAQRIAAKSRLIRVSCGIAQVIKEK